MYIENINMTLWKSNVKSLIDSFKYETSTEGRLSIFHKIFDFVTLDLLWTTSNDEDHTKFMKTMIKKLGELKKDDNISMSEREYFRLIEERLGIFKYCQAKTLTTYRCSKKISIHSKHIYCDIHTRKIKKLSKEINKILLHSDASMLIAEYL